MADTSTSLDVVGSAVEHSGPSCEDIASFTIYKTVHTVHLQTEITKISMAEDTNDKESYHRLNEIVFLISFTQLLYISLSVSFMLYNDIYVY
jgi:hypothetical protein